MFAAMIRELQAAHQVIITCRPLANTIDLLKLHNLDYAVVGTHYGASFAAKLLGYPIRVTQLVAFLANKSINVAISQSSFHSPVVARLLGTRSIYMNDNEHAIGNVPSFLFADRIMVPEYLKIDRLRRQWVNPRKVIHYPGVKDGIYLWELAARLRAKRNAGQDKTRPRIYVRPEPWTAQYYKGSRHFLDTLLLGIKPHADIVLLPRGQDQGVHYRDQRFDGIRIVTTALDIADIVPDCDLFIGAGGTMTREMAVLGIPTVSVYQDDLLDVDRYLLAIGAFLHRPQLTALEALHYLDSASRRPANSELLEKGRAAYALVRDTILNA